MGNRVDHPFYVSSNGANSSCNVERKNGKIVLPEGYRKLFSQEIIKDDTLECANSSQTKWQFLTGWKDRIGQFPEQYNPDIIWICKDENKQVRRLKNEVL